MDFPRFNLELIAHGSQQKQSIPISSYVKKYTENFTYVNKIKDSSIPICYFESEQLDAWKNIQLLDQTYVIAANNLELVANEKNWEYITSNSYTSKYSSIAITNKIYLDSYGKKKPLFYKHVLQNNVVDAFVEVLENGNKFDIDVGMVIDIEEKAIYTNYQNYYNPDTGAYRLYYVTSSDSEGNSKHELLNCTPTIHQATWEDVNPDTGKIENLSWSMEPSSAGFTFTIHQDEKDRCDEFDPQGMQTQVSGFFIKPLETSAIKPLMPSGKTPEDPWCIKFSNGFFYENLLGKIRKFWIPEFHQQPFSPTKPYIYSPYRSMLRVNSNTVCATRRYLSTDPSEAKHFTLFVYDADGILQNLYTTDISLHNKRYSNTNVFYEADKILSYDNRNGFVTLSVYLDPNYDYQASYFYEAKDYEYKQLTLNPIQNRSSLSNMWVFYIIPDTHPNDKAIHYIGVDQNGYIIEASQNEGRRHPNFQLFNKDGSYNENTVIGMKYTSMIDSDNFKNTFCIPYVNDYQYYILAETLVMDIGDEKDCTVIDVRRKGASIKEEYFEDAIKANARILQSKLGYGINGQVVPENNIMLTRIPVTLLAEFGGVLSPERAQELLSVYLPAANNMIVDWEYIKPEITARSLTPGQVDFKFSWEGPDLTYNLYRKVNPADKFKLIKSIGSGSRKDVEYSDIISESNELLSGYVYYYSIRVIENGTELPHGDTVSIMVK